MPLSNEDSLRLNVLLAQQVRVIRIDEGKLIVYALTQKGEAKIHLNPNVRAEKYIKEVKDFLSTKALGAPGGFPVFISRWNRMGDLNHSSLDKLLLLGEDEAVIAVVNNKDITPELAHSAWWATQSADNARSMLACPAIVDSKIGKELAQFLIEFLPFEEDPLNMLTSTRLVLQKGLLDEDDVAKLWKKAKQKNTFYVGFLDSRADEMPEKTAAHQEYSQYVERLAPLIEEKNSYAIVLCKLLSESGQSFLNTASIAFKRIPNYDVVAALFESIRRYTYIEQTEYGQSQQHHDLALTPQGQPQVDIEALSLMVKTIYYENDNIKASDALKAVQRVLPEAEDKLQSILFLSRTSQTLLAPTISTTTAVGSLMRKKLKPVFDPILMHLQVLQH